MGLFDRMVKWFRLYSPPLKFVRKLFNLLRHRERFLPRFFESGLLYQFHALRELVLKFKRRPANSLLCVAN